MGHGGDFFSFLLRGVPVSPILEFKSNALNTAFVVTGAICGFKIHKRHNSFGDAQAHIRKICTAAVDISSHDPDISRRDPIYRLDCNTYPRGIVDSRMGGVVVKIMVPEKLWKDRA